jgi:hypothetical protein
LNQTLQTELDNLLSEDRELQNKAFLYLLDATSQPVDWAYAVWDKMELIKLEGDPKYRKKYAGVWKRR